jgi:glutaminyl-peptide cyclotransferase
MMRNLAVLIAWAALVSATTPPTVVPQLAYKVDARFPHDRNAYTEGLFARDGLLYESTGREGQSDIRRVRLADGRVLKSVKLAPDLFGEGIVDWNKEIISVTWKTGVGFRWSLKSLKKTARFSYPGEGWGMTQDGASLILSDGTSELRVLDPLTFKEQRRISVSFRGAPLNNLNELEWVKGAIYANVWMTNAIVRIDPASGKVTGMLDLSALAAQVPVSDPDSVLNGIAYDVKTDRLLVTGKNWPSLFALKIW